MSIDLPKDLIELIEQLVIYEDMMKEKEIDNFQYEYAYIEDSYIEDAFEDIYDDESPTIIKISL